MMKIPSCVGMVATVGLMACTVTYAENTTTPATTTTPTTSSNPTVNLASDAYIFAYPLVTMDVTRAIMTNVAKPEGNKAPMGQFAHVKEHPTVASKDSHTRAPNGDILYSYAWLDLKNEPYVLHVPSVDRYHLMPLLSGWTEVFDVPGQRVMGSKATDYAIVGPNWKGNLPKGLIKLKSPTNLVWIPGHIYCINNPEELKTVNAIQDQYKLTPLSSFGKSYTPAEGKVDSNIDMTTPVREQVDKMDGATFFKRFAELLKTNPLQAQDTAMLAKLAKLGIVPGKDFDPSKLTAADLDQAVKIAQEKIKSQEKLAHLDNNGWKVTMKSGRYGKDYLQRAYLTAERLGANKPQDDICPMAAHDSTGNVLNGANRYQIHFAKGQLPKAKGFWSITLYDNNLLFSENPLNRHLLSAKNDLKYNADGSLDIYVQNESPGSDKESNWLPAPQGDFVLMQRYYWPGAAVIGNTNWTLPKIENVGKSAAQVNSAATTAPAPLMNTGATAQEIKTNALPEIKTE